MLVLVHVHLGDDVKGMMNKTVLVHVYLGTGRWVKTT